MKLKTKDLTYIALLAALIAVCTWIAIPFAIPFTMQTFAVFLTVILLGGRRGSIAVLVYILLGVVGLPVFSGFRGGIGHLMGATGGYILGFLAAALVMWLLLHLLGRSLFAEAVAMLAGLLVCYAFGTAWYLAVYLGTSNEVALGVVLSTCVIPFILPDLAKIALALFLGRRLKKYLSK